MQHKFKYSSISVQHTYPYCLKKNLIWRCLSKLSFQTQKKVSCCSTLINKWPKSVLIKKNYCLFSETFFCFSSQLLDLSPRPVTSKRQCNKRPKERPFSKGVTDCFLFLSAAYTQSKAATQYAQQDTVMSTKIFPFKIKIACNDCSKTEKKIIQPSLLKKHEIYYCRVLKHWDMHQLLPVTSTYLLLLEKITFV